MLSRLVIVFLSRSKHLLISWLHSPSAVILEPRKIKSVTVSIVSPFICHEVMVPDTVILVFSMLSFKPTFSLSSFIFIKNNKNNNSKFLCPLCNPQGSLPSIPVTFLCQLTRSLCSSHTGLLVVPWTHQARSIHGAFARAIPSAWTSLSPLHRPTLMAPPSPPSGFCSNGAFPQGSFLTTFFFFFKLLFFYFGCARSF